MDKNKANRKNRGPRFTVVLGVVPTEPQTPADTLTPAQGAVGKSLSWTPELKAEELEVEPGLLPQSDSSALPWLHQRPGAG